MNASAAVPVPASPVAAVRHVALVSAASGPRHRLTTARRPLLRRPVMRTGR